MDLIPLEQNIYFPFSTRNPFTAKAQNADLAPTGAVYKLGSTTPMGISVTITNLASPGQYTALVGVTAVNGFAKDEHYNLRINAVVETIQDEAPIAMFRVGREIQATDNMKGLTAEQLMAMAATGAGAGKVDTGIAFDDDSKRTETFKYPDDSDAFVVVADNNGNRQTVTFP